MEVGSSFGGREHAEQPCELFANNRADCSGSGPREEVDGIWAPPRWGFLVLYFVFQIGLVFSTSLRGCFHRLKRWTFDRRYSDFISYLNVFDFPLLIESLKLLNPLRPEICFGRFWPSGLEYLWYIILFFLVVGLFFPNTDMILRSKWRNVFFHGSRNSKMLFL